MAFSKPTYNFMLLGKTGYGKSSTANTLINRRNVFKASNETGSCTKEPKLECGSFENYIIKVVDTPGLQDTNDDMKVTLDYICNGMALLPDGFDALLLVMKYGERCTKEVVEVISALRASFGHVFAKEYCIIVMTHGDNFDTNMNDEDHPDTFYEYCKKIKEPPELLSILKDCDYRVVLFYNKTKGKREETIKTLLQLVQTMKHRSQRYNEDTFARCATERKKYVIGLKLPQLIPAIQEKLSLIQEELERARDDPDSKFDLEIKRQAQKLLDTIEIESGGTHLMDDLKKDVRRIISSVDALSLKKQDRKQMLQKLHDLVGSIKHPPSRNIVILSGIMTCVLGAVSGACMVGTLINPLFGLAAGTNLAAANVWRRNFVEARTSFQEDQERHERALKEIDKIQNDLKK